MWVVKPRAFLSAVPIIRFFLYLTSAVPVASNLGAGHPAVPGLIPHLHTHLYKEAKGRGQLGKAARVVHIPASSFKLFQREVSRKSILLFPGPPQCTKHGSVGRALTTLLMFVMHQCHPLGGGGTPGG